MRKAGALVAAACVFFISVTALANFTLTGTQHLDVSEYHATGVLNNASTADVLTGGSIDIATINDSAGLTISGGGVGHIDAYGTSRIDIADGTVSSGLDAYGNNQVSLSDGSIDYLWAGDSANVDVSGGTIASLYAYRTTNIAISGGTVAFLSTMKYNGVIVTVSGGNISDLEVGGGPVDISGGTVSTLGAYGTTNVTLRGREFQATNGLQLIQYDTVAGVPQYNVLGTGTLAGKWFDGTLWTMAIPTNSATATIRAVPEPATLSLLALGAMGLLARRRRGALMLILATSIGAVLPTTAPLRADTIYVSEYHGTIMEFTPAGVGSVFASDPTQDSPFLHDPAHMTFDKSGNLYAANTYGYTIGRFTPAGAGSLFANTVWPIGVACDSANNVYVASYYTGNIEKFSPAGVDLGIFASPAGDRIEDLAIDSQDNLYCIFSKYSSAISKIAPNGTVSVFADTSSTPNRSLGIDNADNLYVSTVANGSYFVKKFSSTGTDLGLFASMGLNDPAAIAVDSSGDLYAVYHDSGVIEEFSPSGADLGAFASGLSSPLGIAIQVPEPVTLGLLAFGSLLLTHRRRRCFANL